MQDNLLLDRLIEEVESHAQTKVALEAAKAQIGTMHRSIERLVEEKGAEQARHEVAADAAAIDRKALLDALKALTLAADNWLRARPRPSREVVESAIIAALNIVDMHKRKAG